MNNPKFEICSLDVFVVEDRGCIQVFNPFYEDTFQWLGEVVSPTGSYSFGSQKFRAMRSQTGKPTTFGGAISKDSETIRNQFVSYILSQGWEPTNNKYYGQTFRRHVE